MNTVAIRGATNIYINSENEIIEKTEELLRAIIEKNSLDIKDIISIIFTATEDLTKVYPAKAARNIGITRAGLMCLNEMYVENSMTNCLRVLVLSNSSKTMDDIRHVYLYDTIKLRPDLKKL